MSHVAPVVPRPARRATSTGRLKPGDCPPGLVTPVADARSRSCPLYRHAFTAGAIALGCWQPGPPPTHGATPMCAVRLRSAAARSPGCSRRPSTGRLRLHSAPVRQMREPQARAPPRAAPIPAFPVAGATRCRGHDQRHYTAGRRPPGARTSRAATSASRPGHLADTCRHEWPLLVDGMQTNAAEPLSRID